MIPACDVFHLGVYGWVYSAKDESQSIHFRASNIMEAKEIIKSIVEKLKIQNSEIVYYESEELSKIWTNKIDGAIDFGHILSDGKKILSFNLENCFMFK